METVFIYLFIYHWAFYQIFNNGCLQKLGGSKILHKSEMVVYKRDEIAWTRTLLYNCLHPSSFIFWTPLVMMVVAVTWVNFVHVEPITKTCHEIKIILWTICHSDRYLFWKLDGALKTRQMPCFIVEIQTKTNSHQ